MDKLQSSTTWCRLLAQPQKEACNATGEPHLPHALETSMTARSRGEGYEDVEAVREENDCAASWGLAMLPVLSPVTLHDPDAPSPVTT